MKTISAIITLRGGLAKLQANEGIHVENKPFMPLVIVHVGTGPHRRTLISVAHTCVENGDTVYDPEMEFEIIDDPQRGMQFSPVSWRQRDDAQTAVWTDDHNQLRINARIGRDLQTFARQWDKKLIAQGFLIAARRG